ncbi:type-F conjugative transfer system pilin assembly protein TrbC [Thermodesulfovibrio yellowstonii]|uniref:type-F conjugative transfer system pilin assembly protein TrbC n=1 Tax=Thermodesulfovibrio yellowstonii TaxID=28262 RepID=UPI0003FEB144|nr:type-F conjugative transfer system pilin assembly protein TrbC [Thermodesulfovibrio islandicus]
MPDLCYRVDKVNSDAVYLVKDSTCQPVSMIKVTLSKSIETVKIYVDGKFWKTYTLKDKTLEQSIGKLSNQKIDVKLPENKMAQEEALRAYQYYQSEEFQREVVKFRESLTGMLQGVPQEKPSYYQIKPKSVFSDNERIYVFVSSSMPLETVRAYAKDASLLGDKAVLVMRGAIGGLRYLKPTAEWSVKVLKKDPYCEDIACETWKTKIIIDPFLFRKYSIDKVPAVVYVKGLQNTEGLSEGLQTVKVGGFWISYGDVALSYHLKLIGEKIKDQKLISLAESFEK